MRQRTILGFPIWHVSTWILVIGVTTAAFGQPADTESARERPDGTKEALQRIQEQMSQHKILDGIQLTNAYLDSDRQLSFEGQCWAPLQPEQEDMLKKVVLADVKEHWEGVRAGLVGLDFGRLTRVPNLVRDLQDQIALQVDLDGVRIVRNYFRDGTLILQGVSGSSDQQALVKAYVRETLEPTPQWERFIGDRWKLDLSGFSIEELLDDAQTTIATERKLDGIRLDRAYFGADNWVTFEGIVWGDEEVSRPSDDETALEQQKLLQDVLSRMMGTRWAELMTRADVIEVRVGKLTFVRSPLPALRRYVSQRPELDGVWIARHYYRGGSLYLQGIQGNDEQKQVIEQFLQGQFTTNADWARLEASRWSLDLETVPNDEFLTDIQDAIAQAPELDGIRIDRGNFNEQGQLSFTGVSWAQASALERLPDLIAKRTASKWPRILEASPVPEVDVKLFDLLESPLPQIRQLIPELPNLDGIRVDRAYYNSLGKLTIEGIQNKAATNQIQEFSRAMEETLGGSPEWQQWTGGKAFVFQLHPIDFDRLCSDLQRELIHARGQQGSLVDKVRIDRIFFDSNGQVRMAGIRFREDERGDAAAIEELLLKELADWPRVLAAHSGPLDMEGIVLQPSGLAYLRRLAAERDELRGIRLDTAYYDGRGVLHFSGAKQSQEQSAQLQEALTQQSVLDAPTWQIWTSAGWQIDPMPVVPLENIAAQVRRHMVDDPALDGASVERLYYDTDLRLVVEGHFRAGTSTEEVIRIILDVLERESSEALRTADGAPALVSGRGDTNVEDRFALHMKATDNILAHLRSLIPSLNEMDGIRVDRAYHNEQQTLVVYGLLGDERQRAAFATLLDGLSEKQRWSQQLAHGYSLDGMEVEPIVPLKQFIQNALPWHEELDCAMVTRVFHCEDGTLALAGRVVDDAQRTFLGDLITLKLQALPQWHSRLVARTARPLTNPAEELSPVDVSAMDISPIKGNRDTSVSLYTRGRELYFADRLDEAIDRFTLAIIHDSHNTRAWQYRALCYLALGKDDLAWRDVYRTVLMEQNGQAPRNAHCSAMTRIQGPYRQSFERMRLNAMLVDPNHPVARLSPRLPVNESTAIRPEPIRRGTSSRGNTPSACYGPQRIGAPREFERVAR